MQALVREQSNFEFNTKFNMKKLRRFKCGSVCIRKAEPQSPKINLTAEYKTFVNLCDKYYGKL